VATSQFFRAPSVQSVPHEDPDDYQKRQVRTEVAARIQAINPQAGFDQAMAQNQTAGEFPASTPAPVAVAPQSGFDRAFIPTRAPSSAYNQALAPPATQPASYVQPSTPEEAQPVAQEPLAMETQPAFVPRRVPSGVQNIVNAGEPRPERPIHTGGVGSRLKDGFKAFLEGLAMPQQSSGDPRQDLFNRLGAGAGAFAVGTANPQAVHDYQYQTRTLPRWREHNQEEQANADAKLKRADEYAKMSGVNPLTGQPTPTMERFNQQMADSAERIRQGDERIAQGDTRLQQSEDRALTAEKKARIGNLLAAARLPGRVFTKETRAELQDLLGVTLPEDFNPQTHDIKVGPDGSYQIISVDKETGKATVQPVTTSTGQPLRQPTRATQSRNPQFYYEGKARTELQKEKGIADPAAWVDNPQFQDAVEREIEADKQAAKAGGYDPSSRTEIERRVQRKQRIAPKVRAGSLITNEMVKERAAQIYQREGGAAAPGAAGRGNAPSRQQQMQAHEREYQQLYPKLSAADRQALEDAYKKDYGRLPRKPAPGH
jgi:hypothetical protein